MTSGFFFNSIKSIENGCLGATIRPPVIHMVHRRRGRVFSAYLSEIGDNWYPRALPRAFPTIERSSGENILKEYKISIHHLVLLRRTWTRLVWNINIENYHGCMVKANHAYLSPDHPDIMLAPVRISSDSSYQVISSKKTSKPIISWDSRILPSSKIISNLPCMTLETITPCTFLTALIWYMSLKWRHENAW